MLARSDWLNAPAAPPKRRLVTALCLSVLLHALLAGDWHSGSGGHRDTTMAAAALQARLEAAPAPLSQPAPDVRQEPLPTASPRRADKNAGPAALPARPLVAAGDSGPDPRFYLARELDQYPMPLTALRAPGAAVGGVRLWASIDQTGQVVEVAVIDAASAESASDARGQVLSTRFEPGRRDGRAVKSRVLLVLGRDG